MDTDTRGYEKILVKLRDVSERGGYRNESYVTYEKKKSIYARIILKYNQFMDKVERRMSKWWLQRTPSHISSTHSEWGCGPSVST
jgi:hypothetical protein